MQRISICLTLLTAITIADDPDGPQLLQKIIDHMNPENAQAVMEQTIVTSTGDKRTFKYDTFLGNRGEYSLMRYLEPSRVKGNAMLMTDFSDNIWMYNRRTDRVRKLASSAKNQKFEGSDFTYEDMGSGDSWKDDYKPMVRGTEKIDGTRCYTLELLAKATDLSYSKMICFVRIADSFPIRVDYYDKNEVFTKSLYLEDIQTIEGILTPMKMTMRNHHDNTETVMKYLSITYDVTFDKNFFTERNLKR